MTTAIGDLFTGPDLHYERVCILCLNISEDVSLLYRAVDRHVIIIWNTTMGTRIVILDVYSTRLPTRCCEL
jgi:hypothetical protein